MTKIKKQDTKDKLDNYVEGINIENNYIESNIDINYFLKKAEDLLYKEPSSKDDIQYRRGKRFSYDKV
ncbi:hypothetical protein ABE132_14415 [Peribacillus simplex]|uniref:hypothetical protein n=1 Tax=Peribacillus simplex TaxID=1478 RepID=UPI003D2930B6